MPWLTTAGGPTTGTGTSFGVTAAVVLAALLHATWNAIAHRIPDQSVGGTLIGLSCTGAALCLVPWVAVPSRSAWPFLLGSAAMHGIYLLLLMRSYRLGDFNRMYPLARGISPLVVAILAATLVGQDLSAVEALGVITISAGLAVLAFAGGLLHKVDRAAVAAAALTGLAIATYTVLDGVGVRRSGTTIGYIGWLFLLQGPLVPLFVLARRGRRLGRDVRPYLVVGLSSGVISVVAYGIVVWAQTRSSLASVAALRETSIIFAALIGMVLFHERFGIVRTVGASLAVVGILLLNR